MGVTDLEMVRGHGGSKTSSVTQDIAQVFRREHDLLLGEDKELSSGASDIYTREKHIVMPVVDEQK